MISADYGLFMPFTSPFLIIHSPYYRDIAEALLEGATQTLIEAGCHYELLEVPGVLEIPAALAMRIEDGYAGYILLGCVIRGETSHYDIVANISAQNIYHLVIKHKLALGNAILTVENHDQALVRAQVSQKNKGKDAALAALALAKIRSKDV